MHLSLFKATYISHDGSEFTSGSLSSKPNKFAREFTRRRHGMDFIKTHTFDITSLSTAKQPASSEVIGEIKTALNEQFGAVDWVEVRGSLNQLSRDLNKTTT